MKLNFTRACCPSNFSTFIKPSLCTNLHRPLYSSSLSSSHTSLKPQIPLFLRPPMHSATVSDLQKWHDWAKRLASSVGTTFLDSDNGPDSSLLCRELKWLVEDTIEDHSVLSQMSIENGKRSVRLRACLEDLYNMWKQRIEERKPFQYIVGCEHWRDLVLSVQEGVLIPRPETELIVDLVADVVSENEDLREGLWADLGTGSGALAVGIGRILGSRGMVIATDLNPIALSVAAFNLQRDLQLSSVILGGDSIEVVNGINNLAENMSIIFNNL
ncbi:hypothetical protein F2P56_003991 [Juglans regia]|uniref:Release factor glutamine methyltransferase-like n=1 Tax=Juglans regia TaxID=51240 RepID=A0A833Y7D2_JUGRE|nr:hypothetical protein F2P56_003991 [Juglans regia]